jgi:hypothetical protein
MVESRRRIFELNTRLIDRFLKAAAESRWPIAALLTEAMLLRLSPSHLGFSEYLNFKLYRDDLDSKSKKHSMLVGCLQVR